MTQPREIKILTCDHCGRDIGLPDGFGSRPHYEVRVEWPYPSENESRDFCSAECLLGAAQAANAGESRVLERIDYKP